MTHEEFILSINVSNLFEKEDVQDVRDYFDQDDITIGIIDHALQCFIDSEYYELCLVLKEIKEERNLQ